MSSEKIKVMIVDDSATARRILSDIINRDPVLEVVAMASDPYQAVTHLKREKPDVMVLDVQMPRMDGITFLKKLMAQNPLPVVMCSSFTEKGSDISLQALENGAIDIIAKPKLATRQVMLDLEVHIHESLKSAAHARLKRTGATQLSPVRRVVPAAASKLKVTEKLTADAILPAPKPGTRVPAGEKLIAVGASTGGTDALKEFLMSMPLDCPPIVIVQHMPENFTRSFATRLNELCDIRVKEAANGDNLGKGQALIAPGSHHMLLKRSGYSYTVSLEEGPLVSRHRPSVDVLFRSVATRAGSNAIGVMLTGMGDDGAHSMKEMKDMGAYNFAQDEDSCVVFGMPNEAIKLGAVDQILPLNRMAEEVIKKAK